MPNYHLADDESLSDQRDAEGVIERGNMKTNLQKKALPNKNLFNKTLAQIAVTSALLTLGLNASANSIDTEQDSDLDKIVVTANRSQQDQFLALSSTQVIGQTEIQAIQPQNITELLNTVAGVSVVNQGGAGQASSVYMRGTNSNHTLVLVDGVRVGSATLGTTSFSSMSVGLIDRIEVVKGPRGALWGADAIGGVIQIFTKKLQSGEGVVSAGIGSHGLWKTEAAVGLGNDDHSLTLSASVEDSDGFNATDYAGQEDKDGYDRQSFSINGHSQLTDEFAVNLVSRYEKGGAKYDTSWAGSADENEHDNYSAKISGEYQSNNLFVETSYAASQDQGSTFSGSADPRIVNEITTKRDQFGLLGQYIFSDVTSFTAGFDWYNEKVSGTSASYEKDSRKASALFVQARHQVDAVLFEAALRQDDIQGLDKETTYNVSAGYQLSDDWLISLSKGTGFKAPTFNDLYWPGSGNPNLNPEKVDSTELLSRYKFESGSVEVSVYKSDIENLIAWAPDATGSWKPSNINSATAEGVELTVSVQQGPFSHSLAAAYVETEDESTGKQLTRRPKVTSTYTLGYQFDALSANLILDYRGDSEESTKTLDSVLLTNLSLSYQLSSELSVTGKVNNLFDENYTLAEHYLTDGTNYQLLATYAF